MQDSNNSADSAAAALCRGAQHGTQPMAPTTAAATLPAQVVPAGVMFLQFLAPGGEVLVGRRCSSVEHHRPASDALQLQRGGRETRTATDAQQIRAESLRADSLEAGPIQSESIPDPDTSYRLDVQEIRCDPIQLSSEGIRCESITSMYTP